jgi:hypothetical protein
VRMTPLQYVQTERTRHGKTVYYFRRGASCRVRLPGEPGSPEFEEQYNLLASRPADAQSARMKHVREQRLALEKLLAGRVSRAKTRDAARRGVKSTITTEWALNQMRRQKYCCAITGLPFQLMAENPNRMQPFAPSLDRIDVSQGYVLGNVRIVILAINVMRLDWGKDVFDTVVKAYKSSRTTPPGAGENQLNTCNHERNFTGGDPG